MIIRKVGDKSPEYYNALWENVSILPSKLIYVNEMVNIMFKNKDKYASVERKSGVPWEVVAVLHMRESSFDFACNLHNGEPLNQVTKLVPAGRGPFKDWQSSAIDAFSLKKLPEVWNVANTSYFIESYNGFGYCTKGKNSPYLWSFTNHGIGVGKYVADGHYDVNFVDGQCGCMAPLKLLGIQNNSNLFKKSPTRSSLIMFEPVIKMGKSDPAKDLQIFLNKIFVLNGMEDRLKEDGDAGAKTSDAFHKVFGSYLVGDSRKV